MIASRVRFPLAGAASIAFALLLAMPAGAQVAITINGNGVDVSPSPIMQTGRVFVPLRGVFENLGASVVYSNGRIDATGNGREISLQIGSTQTTVDGVPQTIDVAPFIIGASTYVPLRFVSQALGAGVSWNENTRVVEISMAGVASPQAYAQDSDWVDAPPPAMPNYDVPPVPQPNDIWVPGYWAWGQAGYYWVPGIWSQAPQPGLLWTPGYWAWNSGSYAWHPGYWATNVGYYGGINYGAGYYGHGYAGGRWSGDTFRYNTAVTPVVNKTVITNVYIDKTVIVNNTTINRASYNGGPGGVAARPTNTEATAARAPHRPMTVQQQQHVQTAAQDRRGLATVNAGRPPVTVAPVPFTPARKPAGIVPVTPQDKAAAQKFVTRPAVAAPPAAPLPTRPAFERRAPAVPPAARVAPAPVAPAPAIVHHAPPVLPAARVVPVVPRAAPPAAPVPTRPAFERRVPAVPPAARVAPAPVAPAPAIAHPAAPVAPTVAHPKAPVVRPVRRPEDAAKPDRTEPPK